MPDDERIRPTEGLALPAQLIADELILVLHAIRGLLLGDEEPDLLSLLEREHAVFDSRILDGEQALKLHPGIGAARVQFRKTRMRGWRGRRGQSLLHLALLP